MVSQGKIRRIRRGLFDIPRKHRLLGELSPDPMEVARSVMEGSHARWQASGAYAANLLGLSEQVPAKVVILTDGLAQTISLGKQQVIFRRTSPRNLIGGGISCGADISGSPPSGQRGREGETRFASSKTDGLQDQECSEKHSAVHADLDAADH